MTNHTRSLSSLGVLFAFATVLLISTSDAFSINSVNSAVQSAHVLKLPYFEHSKCHTTQTRKNNIFYQQKTQPHTHYQSHYLTTLFNTNSQKEDLDVSTTENPLPSYGGLLGKITGLSMTAIRQSIRTTTGLSLTATRTALRGLTGVSVTGTMKMLFGIFPPWFRYFLQPLFIVYYTPLMILKYFIGSTKTSKMEAYAAHEKVIEGWKDAIRAAEVAQDFWPLHISEDGKIESLTPQSVPINDVIVESLDIASTIRGGPNSNETPI